MNSYINTIVGRIISTNKTHRMMKVNTRRESMMSNRNVQTKLKSIKRF